MGNVEEDGYFTIDGRPYEMVGTPAVKTFWGSTKIAAGTKPNAPEFLNWAATGKTTVRKYF